VDCDPEKPGTLDGKKVLITAGPTHEAIDPVRFIGNHSSGKMGFAIAEAYAERGADVTLVSGPTSLQPGNNQIEIHRVTSAAEMYDKCLSLVEQADIVVFSAAVADFTPEIQAAQKIKSGKEALTIRLRPTVDIAAELGKNKRTGQLFVGFALETQEGVKHAREKLVRKNFDLVVLNSLEDKGAGFGTETNKVAMIDTSGNIDNFALKLKRDVARDIVGKTIKMLNDA
jgi:phosphopantothenoylcysteine decarboxylase / phosphopantothenate---cysteine ligase